MADSTLWANTSVLDIAASGCRFIGALRIDDHYLAGNKEKCQQRSLLHAGSLSCSGHARPQSGMSPLKAVSAHRQKSTAELRQFNRSVCDALIRALDIQDVVIAGGIGSERVPAGK